MMVQRYEAVLEEQLDEEFLVLFAPNGGASAEEMAAVRARFGCAFPEDYVALVRSQLNGLYAEAKEDAWPRRQGGRFWMFQYALLVYGVGGGLPDWIDLEVQAEAFQRETGSSLVPCMRTIASPDPYCFDPEGLLLRWDHETHTASHAGSTFFDAFRQEVETLRKNTERAILELL